MISISDGNGNFIDLHKDTAINFELNNPIFSDQEIIPGSFTLPFDIPGGKLSGKNARSFAHPDVPERRGGKLVFKNRTIFFEGSPYKRGDFVINPVSEESYQANFLIGLRSLSNAFRNTRLKDLLSEEIVITTNTYTKRVYAKPAPSAVAPYKIKVNGTLFEGNTLEFIRDSINSSGVGASAVLTGAGNTPGGNFAADFLEIYPTVDADNIETEFHVDAEDNTFEKRSLWQIETTDIAAYHADFKSWFTAAFSGDKFRLPLVVNDGFYDDYKNTAAFTRRVREIPVSNLVWDGQLVTGDPNIYWSAVSDTLLDFLVANYCSLQPFLMLKYVFSKISEVFGVNFEGDFLEQDYYDKALLDNNFACEHRAPYIGPIDFLFLRPSFNVSELVPDITIEQFLKELQNKFNLMIYYDDLANKVVVKSRKPMMLAADYEDITNLAAPHSGIDDVSFTGVRLKTEKDETDKLSAAEAYDVGEVEHEIVTTIKGISKIRSVSLYNLVVLFPEISSEKVTGPYRRSAENEDSNLRLFFYDGWVDYPAATIDHPDVKLKYPDADGLFEQEWKQYVRFLMNRKAVTFDINFEFRHLQTIDWEKKYMIDRVKYFIKSIQVKLTQTGIRPSKVIMYTA